MRCQNFAGLVFTQWSKNSFFCPTGATRCPDKRENPPCSAKFHLYQGKNVGIQLPKLSKFRILARNLYLRGDSIAIFFSKLSAFLRVYRYFFSFKLLVWSLSGNKQLRHKHFPAVGAFSLKFSNGPSVET